MAGENIIKERLYGIDFVKGCLIILVFVGHIIPGVIDEVFPRYAIYFFHMPLFIGISGFLLNIERMDMTISKLLPKYWNRLLLPWVIAVLFFFFDTHLYKGNPINVKEFAFAFCHPFYHLWYILGFVSYLVISCALWTIFKKSKLKWVLILGVAFAISIISKCGLLSPFFSDGFANQAYEAIQFDFRLWNYVFFVLGLFFRYCYEHGKILSVRAIDILRSILVVAMIIVGFMFFNQNSTVTNVLFFVLCVSFLIVTLYDCVNKSLPRSKILEFLGEYSLPLYLYHVFCKQIANLLFGEGTTAYYFTSLIGFILLCVFVYVFRNNTFFGRFLFGIVRKNK